MQDLLARLLTDLRVRQSLAGPLAAELGAVGAAYDAIGAVQAHRSFDRAGTEGIAIHVHLRAAKAFGWQLFRGGVAQAAGIHALDIVGQVAPKIANVDLGLR